MSAAIYIFLVLVGLGAWIIGWEAQAAAVFFAAGIYALFKVIRTWNRRGQG